MSDGYDATELIRSMAPDWTPVRAEQPEQPTPDPPSAEVTDNLILPPSVEKPVSSGILGSQTGLAAFGASVSIPAIVNAKRKIGKRPSVTLFGGEGTSKGSTDGVRAGDGSLTASQNPEPSGGALPPTQAKESKEGWGWFNIGKSKDKDRTKNDDKKEKEKSVGSDTRSGR